MNVTPTKHPTKREIEQYRRVEEYADRLDKIRDRFAAQGITIGNRIDALNLTFETAEEILDRLEAST